MMHTTKIGRFDVLPFRTPTQQKILHTIWVKSRTTQSEISAILEVDKSTVSRNLSPLLKEGIVEKVAEIDPGPSGGRKADVFSINDSWKYFIGIGIEQGEIFGVLTNFAGKSVASTSKMINIDAENIVDVISEVVEDFMEMKNNILGIALGVPGVVDNEAGVIILSESLGLRDFPLEEVLERRFRKKCYIENDSNAAVARCFSRPMFYGMNVLYFLLSLPFDLSNYVGLGVGIAIDGEIYRGSNLLSGETPLKVALMKKKMTLPEFEKSPPSDVDYSGFIKKASEVIATIVNVMDPSVAIIGGDVNLFPDSLLNDLMDSIKSKIFMADSKKLELRYDHDGLKTMALGSVRAFLTRFMKDFEFSKKVFSIG